MGDYLEMLTIRYLVLLFFHVVITTERGCALLRLTTLCMCVK